MFCLPDLLANVTASHFSRISRVASREQQQKNRNRNQEEMECVPASSPFGGVTYRYGTGLSSVHLSKNGLSCTRSWVAFFSSTPSFMFHQPSQNSQNGTFQSMIETFLTASDYKTIQWFKIHWHHCILHLHVLCSAAELLHSTSVPSVRFLEINEHWGRWL